MALELTEQDIVNVGPLELKDLGSPAWCWQTVGLLQNLWGSIDDNVTRYAEVWATAEEYRIWEKIPYEAPYGSLGSVVKSTWSKSPSPESGRWPGKKGSSWRTGWPLPATA